MSLVGPRPLPVDEQQRILATHRRRLSMRPGITGLWQVSGRSNVDFEQWMELDLRYVDQWSLSLDATILLKTVREVILRTGAK
jgi:lipopolysaccharide/colanic/teichoic acid biosynthesis glycosyltransferase